MTDDITSEQEQAIKINVVAQYQIQKAVETLNKTILRDSKQKLVLLGDLANESKITITYGDPKKIK